MARIAATALAVAGAFWVTGQAHAQLGCGGLLRPPCPVPAPPPPPPPPAPVQATLTLDPETATRRVGDLPSSIAFRGTVAGVANPQGLLVELEQVVPSYGPQARLRPRLAQLGADGSFEFTITPPVGVEVRAALRSGQPAVGRSPARVVTLRSRQTLGLRATSATRARFTMTSVGPGAVALESGDVPPLAGPGRVAYLYAVAPGGEVAQRVASGRVGGVSCDGALCRRSARGGMRLTRGVRRARRFFACALEPFFLGLQDSAVFEGCGRARLALR